MKGVPKWVWVLIAIFAVLVIGYAIYYNRQKKVLTQMEQASNAQSQNVGIWDLISQVTNSLNNNSTTTT